MQGFRNIRRICRRLYSHDYVKLHVLGIIGIRRLHVLHQFVEPEGTFPPKKGSPEEVR